MLWVISIASLCLSLFACLVAVNRSAISANLATTSWKAELTQLRSEMIELLETVEQMQLVLRKGSARKANAARWAGKDGGEPDPAQDPEGWKRWANAGGLRQYLKK